MIPGNFFLFNLAKEESCKKEGRWPPHFIKLEISAKVPAKNPLNSYKTVKGDILMELSLFECIQIGSQSDLHP